jgi:hypothetical protein
MFDCDVIVDVLFDRGLLFLVVKNLGERPAFGVSVTFDTVITGVEGHKVISELALFKNIAFLAPKKEITAFLDTSHSYFSRNQPQKFGLTINYTDVAGKKKSGFIPHDISIYRELGYINRTGANA